MSANRRIACEISGSRREVVASLCRIIRTCARDSGQRVSLVTHCDEGSTASDDSVVTLHLPVGLAMAQHPVWCLACQLACFCPTARVSVLVHGENSFQTALAATERRAAS